MKKKIIIVGGVAGGASAAARLRRLDEDAEIVLLEKGEYISFANCGLPYYIGGGIKEKSALTLQTPASFRARFNVDVRTRHEALAINREARELVIKDLAAGKTYTESYDALILSMGADPVKPPISGMDAAGAYEKSRRVFTLRNIPDTFKIKDFIETEKPKTALVMGGGYIGVEMAENLSAAGLEVTIVEMLDQVIAPLDYDMACEVHRHIRSKGVKLRLKTAVTAIREEAAGLSVRVKDEKGEEEIPADMLIMAAGVRPESGIAKEAGLALNQRGAIVVDEHMRTGDEHIYAVGDAVEVTDFVSGRKAAVPLAGPANKQGRIAADNICGIPGVYGGTQGSAILKVFDLTVACTGVNEKTAKRLGLDYDKSF
ncbi:MAG: FAD-dependent oxidoreductase, partial [Treponema sp.]|nr:FAD-dependent oxidoreductase [Treponema sp.]